MKLWKEGDVSAGVCEQCKKQVQTSFERRDVELERPRVVATDVLVAVCNECGNIVAVPPQSSPKLNQARAKEAEKLEARIPKHLEDVLGLVAARFDRTDKEFRASLMRYYLREMGRSRSFAVRVSKRAVSELAKGKADGRISLRLDSPLLDNAWSMAKNVGISNRSKLVVGLIIVAKEDVLDGGQARRQKELELVAAST